MTQPDAAELIARLDLTRHPEGGWFRETYRSSENIPATALPERFNGSRALSTAIYFMLERGDFSALHQIKSDELWHHHTGSSLLIHIFTPDGNYRVEQLGADLAAGDRFQIMVPFGSWFGAELAAGGATFALVGCIVAPGFNFSDFTLADRARLCAAYPCHAPLVRRLTRSDVTAYLGKRLAIEDD